MRVVLVRHAESAVDPSTPSSTWGLTDAGREAASHLDLTGLRLLAGDEPKLIQTLEPHGHVEVEARYSESRSEGWLEAEEFREVIGRYFAHPDEAPAPGWEPASAVVRRFELVDSSAICSGGRAICAVVAHHVGGDGFPLWQTLAMPHVITLYQDESGRWVASAA